MSLIRIFCFVAVSFFGWHLAQAQIPTAGRVAYYSFDDCNATDQEGNTANNGVLAGNPGCGCGVSENALRFDGIDDEVIVVGAAVLNQFTRADFTLAFYFKPVPIINTTGTHTLFHKRANCSNESAFAIRYTPQSGFLNVLMVENAVINSSLTYRLAPNQCWYHIAIIRSDLQTRLFVDGKLVKTTNTATRVNLTNPEPILIGGSSCSSTETRFEGLIDELYFYSRALLAKEVEALNLSPDNILTGLRPSGVKDTLVFLGSDIQIRSTATCATNFSWTPTTGVSDPTALEPIITPVAAGSFNYILQYQGTECTGTDTLRVTVIDPSTLDCTEAFLPNAFTPNDDGLNDTYGIDNSEIFLANGILESFEIFDRWGARVFVAVDPSDRWDGKIGDTIVNPGVYLFKVAYSCNGTPYVNSGSVTVLR